MARESAEFAVVLWGATGFVGRRTAHHLASRTSGTRLPWAIAGRDRTKLDSLRAELNGSGADVSVVVADGEDVPSLDAMVKRAHVVGSAVGPYAKLGSNLVASCARWGTHYCDLSGEAHWIRRMIDRHQLEAERSGARIVPACGLDSIPSDLGVFHLQREAIARHGRPCPSVHTRVVALRGGVSHGTTASLAYGLECVPEDPSIERVMSEPYGLNPEGRRSGPDHPDDILSTQVGYDEDLRGWTKPFFMSPINSKIVRRTNALLGYPYGEQFRYEELTWVGDGPAGWTKAKLGAIGFRAFLFAATRTPTRRLLQRFVFPKPGEGPNEEMRRNGHWTIVVIGHLDDATVIRARMHGAGDPAVESTSRMFAESALCLSEDTDRIAVGGGVWTPASVMGEPLLERLTAHAGITISVEHAPVTDLPPVTTVVV